MKYKPRATSAVRCSSVVIFSVDKRFLYALFCARLFGTTIEQHEGRMVERIHKAALSQSQGREGWSVIFRHPVLLDRTTGKPGRRVRRGLGTKDQKAGGRLVAELNELLADKEFWEPSSIPRAMARFNPLVVDIFYHDMIPDIFNAYDIRDAALAFPLSSDSDYRQVLLLGSTGGGKTTLVRQLIGSDPESSKFLNGIIDVVRKAAERNKIVLH